MKHTKKSLNLMLILYMTLVTMFSTMFLIACYLLIMNTGFLPSKIVARCTSPLAVVVISIMVSTTLSTYAAFRILRPIDSLVKATKQVAKGNFSVRVAPTGAKSEMDELISSFNNMVSELSGIEMFRKDFINNFSHEFKTPIVSIRGFARQLQRDDLSDAERKEYAGIIANEAERLSHMAANVLLLTKLENQQFVTDKTAYRLDEQLRNTILLLEKQWSEKNIDWDVDLREIVYLGNAEMMQHVWMNLLGNAIKFSHDDGCIHIACRLEKYAAVVTVRDEGIGMDEQTRRNIFEKFYQGDSAHAADGNGLGLSLVRRIVDLCGGSVQVESQPNRGSTFTVSLPLSDDSAIC